jgi:CheY-like chemotaxis protein
MGEKPVSVLIAEDNILNQRIIEILIRKMGWKYKMVGDGAEAVEEIQNGSYDVVLMDIDMPVMNGWDATAEMRKRGIEVPVIALTAYSEESFRRKSFEVGMDYFLSKPYDKEQIYEAVMQFVKH